MRRAMLPKITAALGLALLACGFLAGDALSQRGPVARPGQSDSASAPKAAVRLSTANNKFGMELFQKLHKDGDNTFMSPTSVAMAMQMVTEGAKENTLKELQEVLNIAGIQTADANHALINALNNREGIKLNLANSFWGSDTVLDIKPEYIDTITGSYDGEVRAVSFTDPRTREIINKWVADRTKNLIEELLETLAPDTVSVLVNAIYFKGDWATQFDAENTKDADFKLAGGATKEVRMMSRSGRIHYSEHDGVQVAKLPYKGEESSMWVILPPEGKSLDALVKELTPEKFSEWQRATHRQQGTFEMPRFTMRYKSRIEDTLKEMGIRDAMNPNAARFDGIATTQGNQPLFIGAVIHEAVVIVNEEGTEAAAATAVTQRLGRPPAGPFTMTCDRPFLFLITDDATGSVMFLGTVYEPENIE
jgi:serine protease inhibitor